MSDKQRKFFERVHEISDWLSQQPGRTFIGWPKETLFFYVAFHAIGGTIFVVRDEGKLKAVMMATPTTSDKVSEPFKWQQPVDGGAVIVWDLVGSRRFIRSLWGKLKAAFPNIAKYFAYRNKKLVELSPVMLERLSNV